MSKVHAKNAFLSVNASDVGQYADTIEWSLPADAHDITTFGNNSHRKGGGLLDGSCKVSGIYDNAVGSGPRTVIKPLRGTVTTLVYRPEGTGAGRPQDTVAALVTNYVETDGVADYIKWAAEFEFDGDVATVTQ